MNREEAAKADELIAQLKRIADGLEKLERYGIETHEYRRPDPFGIGGGK